jgi:uncharacterized repeat protein (TIGR04138 family)
MLDESATSLQEIIRQVDQYPEEAFLFVRDGLSYAVERVHGPASQAHYLLARYIEQVGMDWDDLIEKYHANDLSEPIMTAIEAAGGCEKLNRHVGGRELCWGLRDYALERWGMMARTVLESWKVRRTGDFGRIVFAFIEGNLMQKQENDDVKDFEDVYSFEEAFDKCYRVGHKLDAEPGANN